MARPAMLSQEEIVARLSALPLWSFGESYKPQTITRELSAADFVSAIGAVNAIAILAESMDHHPDILVYGWNKVRVTLSTHDVGGLTVLDFELAHKIDGLGFGIQGL